MTDPYAELRARLAPFAPDDEDLRVLSGLAPAIEGIEQLLASVDLDDV